MIKNNQDMNVDKENKKNIKIIKILKYYKIIKKIVYKIFIKV